jgi:hypothetical protein
MSPRCLGGVESESLRRSAGHGFMKAIERAQRLITVDPEVLGGTPVFAGTRVPIDTILTDEHLEAARVYSEVYPGRARLTKCSTAQPSWKIKSSRNVTRNDTRSPR